MSVDIIIDSREEKLIDALESEYLQKECGHVMFDIQSLDVGDIIYKHQNQILCLIERKTYDDYASSIVDGRSKNQSIRINQLRLEHPDIIIIYLIEGSNIHKDHKFHNGITRNSLYSSIINRVIRDKFTIFKTADINDTALMITKIYDKLLDSIDKKDIQKTAPKSTQIEYLKTIKVSKKDNMTPANCFLCQLSQIPGVSIDIANVISQQYKSIPVLICAYEQCDEKNNMLAELQVPIANQRTRRLGNVLSKRIYEYIYNITEPKKISLKLKIT